MQPVIAFALQILSALPNLIQAGINVFDLIHNTAAALKAMHDEGRDPTDAEWQALHAATQDALQRLDTTSH